MYAVIRAGGKQYRVAPGDVIRVETAAATDGKVEFGDVLAVSVAEGEMSAGKTGATVVGQVVEEGRSPKILVFHYKKKKQYKKLRGHRQSYLAVKIMEIAFGGKTFAAPAEEKKESKRAAKRAVAAANPVAKTKAAKRAAGK